MSIVEHERTSAELVMYALYLYFLGLSFRNTSKALEPFRERKSRVGKVKTEAKIVCYL
jgi:hypothetical protein